MADGKARFVRRRTFLRHGSALVGMTALAALAGCTPPASTPVGPTLTPVSATATPPPVASATAKVGATPSTMPVPSSPTPTGVLHLATNHAAVELPWLRKALESYGGGRVSVEIVNTTSGYLGQVAAWAAEERLPDVVFVRGRHAAAWAYKGWLGPIDDLVRRDDAQLATRDFYQTVRPEVTRDGKWLMLPTISSVTSLIVNGSAFRSADVEQPTGDWDWPEALATARRVSKGAGVRGVRWGLSWRPEHVDLAAIWRANDPAAVPADGHDLAIDNAGCAAALQALADLALVDGVAPTDAELASSAVAFDSGAVAIEAAGSWSASRYRTTTKSTPVVVLPPRGKAGPRGAAVTTAGWALGRDSKRPDDARALLKHLASRDVVDLTIGLPMRDLPARQSSAALWLDGLRAIDGPRDADAIARLAGEATSLPAAPWWMEFQDACDDLLPTVWAGQKKAADVLPEIQRRVSVAARRMR